MWMCDLEKATSKVAKFLGPRASVMVFESIKPSYDGGIVFKTTCHSYIKWFPNGMVIERDEGTWRR